MTMEHEELERAVQQALANLPSPRAPHGFHLRVMAAVVPAAVVGRPWFTWPWPMQAAVLVLLVGLGAGGAWAWPALVAWVGAMVPGQVHAGVGFAGGAAETGASLLRVMELTWSAVVAPMARLVLLLTVTLCAACAVCLAALSRVALGGASQS